MCCSILVLADAMSFLLAIENGERKKQEKKEHWRQ